MWKNKNGMYDLIIFYYFFAILFYETILLYIKQ